MHYHAWLICKTFKDKSHYVAQAGLKFLGSSDPPALAFQSAGIPGLSHRAWQQLSFLFVVVVETFCEIALI